MLYYLYWSILDHWLIETIYQLTNYFKIVSPQRFIFGWLCKRATPKFATFKMYEITHRSKPHERITKIWLRHAMVTWCNLKLIIGCQIINFYWLSNKLAVKRRSSCPFAEFRNNFYLYFLHFDQWFRCTHRTVNLLLTCFRQDIPDNYLHCLLRWKQFRTF